MLPQSLSRRPLPLRCSRLAFVATVILCGAAHSTDGWAQPPRLGFWAVDVPQGKKIVRFEADAPVQQKLQVGDVIVGARATRERIRFRMDNPRGLWDLCVALAGGQNVVMLVHRPRNPAAPSEFVPLEIMLEPSDLYGRARATVAAEPAEHRNWAYTQVPTAAEARTVEEGPDGIVTVELFYATDRAVDAGQYTGARDLSSDGPLKFGICKVSIPPNHRIGEIESPKWWRFEFSPNPLHHVVVTSISQLPEASFFALLSQTIALESPDVKRVLVFIHGYNVDFGEAARRTAQMHYDLNFPGVSLFYSWPSNGNLSGYISDAGDIDWSTPNIERFLSSLEARADIDEIYVVGHSMGNRGLTKALVSMAGKGQGHKIKEIILAAPDVDAVIFERDIAAVLGNSFERTTVYASANDRALVASDTVAEIQRVGEIINGFPTNSSRDEST